MSAPHAIEAVRRRVAEDPPDAVVLCGFGNVGIFALKEILDLPVCSISESSMAMACLLGHRFSTLTMLEQFIPYQQDLVRLYGFEAKCASVRAINVNVERAAIEREETLRQLTSQVNALVAEDGAEVVILACAGLCDYDRALSEASGVPVIDPVVAGVKMAEAFVAMGVSQSKARKFRAPATAARRVLRCGARRRVVSGIVSRYGFDSNPRPRFGWIVTADAQGARAPRPV